MDVSVITAAVIAAVPPTAMAALAWTKGRQNAAAIGNPNGHKSANDGLTAILQWAHDHTELDDMRHSEIVAEQKRVRAELATFKSGTKGTSK